jgi:6-phosphogluconolactonase
VDLKVAQDIAPLAARFFAEVSPRTVALAGGSTPRSAYESIARIKYPWKQTHVFFGDERCAPVEDPDSNFRMASEAFLSKVPTISHPMTGCDPRAYEAELAAVMGSGVPRFDMVFLGLGEDGHTASLFPNDAALEIEDRNVALVDRPDHRRMTLTLPVLSAARTAVFLVSGAPKQWALMELLAGGDIPAARVRAGRVVVIADPSAAGAA